MMKLNSYLLIGLLTLFISCKEREKVQMKVTEKKPMTELKGKTNKIGEQKKVTVQYIENDSLLAKLISDLNRIALNQKFTSQKTPIKNRHVDDLTDTIITLTYDNTILELYKAESEKWIFNAKIKNAEFKLLDSINVYKSKSRIENIIGSELKSDSVKIGNLEQTSVFIFKFENGKLKVIEYQGYVD